MIMNIHGGAVKRVFQELMVAEDQLKKIHEGAHCAVERGFQELMVVEDQFMKVHGGAHCAVEGGFPVAHSVNLRKVLHFFHEYTLVKVENNDVFNDSNFFLSLIFVRCHTS